MRPDQKIRRDRLKSLGICTACGNNESEVGRVRCLECLAKNAKNASQRRNKNRLNGKCRCGREISIRLTCETCKKMQDKRNKRLYNKRKENNHCTRCGNPLLERTNVTKCTNCIEGTFSFNW